jgi:hypothetical protein
MRLGGASDVVGPEGVIDVARLTVPENLPDPTSVMTTELSVAPGASVSDVFEGLIVKSPKTLTLTVAGWDVGPFVAVTVTV